jgi:hypothetical protein
MDVVWILVALDEARPIQIHLLAANAMTPGRQVVWHGWVGAVRQRRLTPGIAVIRFSSLPTEEAIFRAKFCAQFVGRICFRSGFFSSVFHIC